MIIRFLTEDEVDDARSLLYDVYCLELGFFPEQSNKSGQRIDHASGRRCLVDDFDDDAKWTGCFLDCGSLVGCHRMLNRRKKGFVETELYTTLPQRFANGETWEMSRLAIKPEMRKSTALLSILAHETDYLATSRANYFLTTAVSPRPADMYLRMGMKLLPESAFRYAQTDVSPCHVLFFDMRDAECLRKQQRARSLLDRALQREGPSRFQ